MKRNKDIKKIKDDQKMYRVLIAVEPKIVELLRMYLATVKLTSFPVVL